MDGVSVCPYTCGPFLVCRQMLACSILAWLDGGVCVCVCLRAQPPRSSIAGACTWLVPLRPGMCICRQHAHGGPSRAFKPSRPRLQHRGVGRSARHPRAALLVHARPLMGSWSLAAPRSGRADLRGEHMSRGTTVRNFTTQVRLPTSAHIYSAHGWIAVLCFSCRCASPGQLVGVACSGRGGTWLCMVLRRLY